jgi:hypothetical protein
MESDETASKGASHMMTRCSSYSGDYRLGSRLWLTILGFSALATKISNNSPLLCHNNSRTVEQACRKTDTEAVLPTFVYTFTFWFKSDGSDGHCTWECALLLCPRVTQWKRSIETRLFLTFETVNPLKTYVKVGITLRQSLRHGIKPLETHYQRFFQLKPCDSSSYVASSLARDGT